MRTRHRSTYVLTPSFTSTAYAVLATSYKKAIPEAIRIHHKPEFAMFIGAKTVRTAYGWMVSAWGQSICIELRKRR